MWIFLTNLSFFLRDFHVAQRFVVILVSSRLIFL